MLSNITRRMEMTGLTTKALWSPKCQYQFLTQLQCQIHSRTHFPIKRVGGQSDEEEGGCSIFSQIF